MPKLRAGDIRFEVSIEAKLHQRLKSACERLHIPMRHLVVDVLSERVEFLEEQRRLEEERRLGEREAQKAKFGGFRRLSASPLAPVPRPTPLGVAAGGAGDVSSAPPIDYTKHAERIYAALAGGSPLEARLCTNEAVTAIKKRHPLTCPKDEAIVSALEKLVLQMREVAMARTREDAPEIVIDPAKVRTFGDVGVGDGG